MKKIILFISCVFCFGFANAQGPVFEWAKSTTGSFESSGSSITIDASGNSYTTGIFNGTIDFDPGVGIYNLTCVGSEDVFILKLDVNGNFIWAKNIGGNVTSSAISVYIAIDGSNNIYITGYYTGTVDFDPSVGVDSLTSSGNKDIFISKLDSFGNFIWGKSLGGTAEDKGSCIAIDIFDNVYISGSFFLTVDFDPGIGVFNLTSVGWWDVFLMKLDSFGNFVWAKKIGGSSNEFAESIDVDAFGNVCAIGYFLGTVDFDPGLGIDNLISAGGYDIFISKYDPSGNLIWAKNVGGTTGDYAYSVVFDLSGSIYVTGGFQGIADLDPGVGTFYLSSMGGADIFILKLDSSGNFDWGKNIGGVSSDFGLSIKLDGLGNVYTTGYYSDTVDFNPSSGFYNLNSFGNTDIFISKLDSLGNFVWAVGMGGVSLDAGSFMAVNIVGDVYTIGDFVDTVDFDPNFAIFDLIADGGNWNVFVQKLSQPPTSINETTNPNSILIYPNPNNGIFNISISPQIKNAIIEVYNSIGALVYKQEVENQENAIELSNQANGLYFVKVMSDNKIVGMGKIIKE